MKPSKTRFTIVCEKTKTGWSAYVENSGNNIIATTFSGSIADMHKNCLEVLNLYLSECGEVADLDNIVFKFEE